MTPYTIDDALTEVLDNVENLKELVTHPSLTHNARNYVQDAIDALADAVDMMHLESDSLEGDAYYGSWTNADTALKADGTYHLKPALTVGALNKALAHATDADIDAEAWWSRATKRLNPPKGVVREILTSTKHIKYAPSELNALALAGTPK